MIEDEPIIFLDIDGPLVTRREIVRLFEEVGKDATQDRFGHVFDPEAVSALSEIIDRTEAEIVISSTWRYGKSVQDFNHMWEIRDLPGTVIDVTPRCEDAPRGWEIRKWIHEHRTWDFSNYVILDDDGDMLWWQRNNFILVDGETGIGPEHVDLAVQMLTQNNDE